MGRYRKNMRSLYIVHSTFWVKMMVWFFATFTLSDIKRKIHHLAGVEYLYDHMAPDQLDVPAFVAEADFKVWPVPCPRRAGRWPAAAGLRL